MKEVTVPYVQPNFVSDEDCATIVDLIKAYARGDNGCKPSVSNERRTEIAARNVYSHGFRSEAALLQSIRDRCLEQVQASLRPETPIVPTFMILAANYVGDQHVRHSDNSRFDKEAGCWVPNHTPDRIATCGVYLNSCGTDFTGGELVFPTLEQTIRPQPGLLVAFPSDERFEHEVPPVLSGSRYSIYIWFSDNGQKAESKLVQ